MRRNLLALLLVVTAGPLWAGEAHVRIYCQSLRFESATGGPGQVATVRFTTDSGFTEINGEIRPLYDPNLPSHGALFLLEDPTLVDTLVGQIAFDQPQPTDGNGNGFDDFFEVSQGVPSTRVAGIFTTPVDVGSVSATWTRPAGSHRGTCQVQMTGETFGVLPEFTHTFELLEYSGTLTYIAGTNSVSGELALAQTGDPAQILSGPVTITRVETNRFDRLLMAPATLTNAAGWTWSSLPAELERDLLLDTNYFGFLDFIDGSPGTGTPDYQEWVLSIDDANDANSNGIPDLSDDVGTGPSDPLSLTLERSEGPLLLTVRGTPGEVYQLEEATSVDQDAWEATTSVTLTNSSQIVEIPIPTNTQTRFWRARGP